MPIPGETTDSLSKEALQEFRKKSVYKNRLSKIAAEVNDRLLLENLKLFEGENLIRAAILMFHPEPEKWVTGAYIKIGFFAKLLSKFASHPDTGVGVGEAIKMQYAINKVGIIKVLYASFASAVTKLFGKKGVFYEIVGQEVSGLDGFYDHVWSEYRDIGIELPENSFSVCNEIKQKTGISCSIVDANDLGQEILGYSDDLVNTNIKRFIKDNPAGQGKEQTPIVIMRKVEKQV